MRFGSAKCIDDQTPLGNARSGPGVSPAYERDRPKDASSSEHEANFRSNFSETPHGRARAKRVCRWMNLLGARGLKHDDIACSLKLQLASPSPLVLAVPFSLGPDTQPAFDLQRLQRHSAFSFACAMCSFLSRAAGVTSLTVARTEMARRHRQRTRPGTSLPL